MLKLEKKRIKWQQKKKTNDSHHPSLLEAAEEEEDVAVAQFSPDKQYWKINCYKLYNSCWNMFECCFFSFVCSSFFTVEDLI